MEAARAGNQGKGFSVVAEEVRNLAVRSSDAAKEASSLIDNSRRRVDEGKLTMEQTSAALAAVEEHAVVAIQLVEEVAVASTEQAVTIGEMNEGMPMSGMGDTVDAMMSSVTTGNAGDDFMGTMIGTSIIFILIGIVQTTFICGDYSGGFAKNIFTAHASPKDYIGGKLLSMAAASGLMLVFYTIASFVALSIFGGSLALSGGVFGLIAFILQKWLISCAFSALILLVNLFTRNSALGVVGSFLVATGGLSMGIAMFAELFGISWFSTINRALISGVSQFCTLSFSFPVFLNVLVVSVVWMGVCYFSSKRVLAVKDV